MGWAHRLSKKSYYTGKKIGRKIGRDIRSDFREITHPTYEHPGCPVRHRTAEAMLKCDAKQRERPTQSSTGFLREDFSQPTTSPFEIQLGIWPNPTWTKFNNLVWEGLLLENRTMWIPQTGQYSLSSWWDSKSSRIAQELVPIVTSRQERVLVTLSTRKASILRKSTSSYISFTLLGDRDLEIQVQGDYSHCGITSSSDLEERLLWRKILKAGMSRLDGPASNFVHWFSAQSSANVSEDIAKIVQAFKQTLIPTGPIYVSETHF